MSTEPKITTTIIEVTPEMRLLRRFGDLIADWMAENGYDFWEMGKIASRNREPISVQVAELTRQRDEARRCAADLLKAASDTEKGWGKRLIQATEAASSLCASFPSESASSGEPMSPQKWKPKFKVGDPVALKFDRKRPNCVVKRASTGPGDQCGIQWGDEKEWWNTSSVFESELEPLYTQEDAAS